MKGNTFAKKINPNIPVALSGLLRSLPDPSKGWAQGDRDKFYSTFGVVLDFCYPIVDEVDLTSNENDKSGDLNEN